MFYNNGYTYVLQHCQSLAYYNYVNQRPKLNSLTCNQIVYVEFYKSYGSLFFNNIKQSSHLRESERMQTMEVILNQY